MLALGCSSSSTSSSPYGTDSGGGNGDGGGFPNSDGGTGTDGTMPPGDSGGPPPGDAQPPPRDSGGPPSLALSTNIQIVVEPGDNGQQLLSAIQGAQSSVHVTMYLLDDSTFIQAFINLKSAGKDVKVMLNQNFIGGMGSNQSAYDSLSSAGVTVAWAPAGYSLTHEKCVIIDGKTAWIMTMNMENSSPSNREYLAIDTDLADVQEADAIFGADMANKSYAPSGALVVAPNNARAKMLQLIATATKTIDVEGEELSDYMIVGALASAQMAGIHVRVVLSDTTPSTSEQMAITQLKAASVPLVSVSSPYIHAKAFVVDGKTMYVGSANFTTGSLQYNRELGVLTANATAVGSVASTINGDFGSGSPL